MLPIKATPEHLQALARASFPFFCRGAMQTLLPATLQALEHALTTLPDGQRRCLELFFLEKKCYRDISQETGYDLNAAKSHLQNGKRMLRRQLEPPEKPQPTARAPLPADNSPLHVAR